MKVPPDVLLQPWPQTESSPLLTTVFRVLKAVATGTQTPVARPVETEVDAPIDNIGENISTRSPPQSPISSPTKSTTDNYNMRSPNVKPATPSEAEANLRSVRLAARMVN